MDSLYYLKNTKQLTTKNDQLKHMTNNCSQLNQTSFFLKKQEISCMTAKLLIDYWHGPTLSIFVFRKKGILYFLEVSKFKFWLVRWSNGKNFRFVDTRTCISLQLDQYQNHRSHTLKILATTQRWVTSLNSSTPQNKTGIEWVCGAYENFCEDNPPISKPPRILSLRWLDRAFIDFA